MFGRYYQILKEPVMKIIILLFVFIFGFGATVKKSAEDLKELQARAELNQYQDYPNLLPEVEIVAERIENVELQSELEK
jgi:uncharacterized membrane protein